VNILQGFLNEHFNRLKLHPPLFYLWNNGIRFEIRNPAFQWDSKENKLQMKERTKTLFDEIFDDSDEVLFVIDFDCPEGDKSIQRRPFQIRKYIKERQILWKLKHFKIPTLDLYDGDVMDEDVVTHRFILPCIKSELKYVQVLKSISSEEIKYQPSVYFINLSRRIIFHHYGDGCDIISKNQEDLRFLFNHFNHWILDYDRKKIEKLFE
jgi:hypothetical protein